MRDSSLRELPASALALGPAVKTLDAGNNRIAVLPPALGGLASLQRLVLTQNRLEAIGPVVQLSALKILLLDGNLLGSLPPALGQLTKLEKLSVSGNSLATLPAEIGCLRRARQPPARGGAHKRRLRCADVAAAAGRCGLSACRRTGWQRSLRRWGTAHS